MSTSAAFAKAAAFTVGGGVEAYRAATLWCAVIGQAVSEAASHDATLRTAARGWLFNDPDFLVVCEIVGLDPEWVRAVARRRLGIEPRWTRQRRGMGARGSV